MTETPLPSKSLPQVRRALLRLSQAVVLAYLVAGLLALAGVPLSGGDWLHLHPVSPLDGILSFNFGYFVGIIFLAR